jgi:hypothetical protein
MPARSIRSILGSNVVGLHDLGRLVGELADVVAQVVGEVLVVVEQGGEGERRGVVEAVTGRFLSMCVLAPPISGRAKAALATHRVLGRREHGIHAAQDKQRQHDRAVLVLLEGAAELVRDLPDEGNLVLEANWRHVRPSTGL